VRGNYRHDAYSRNINIYSNVPPVCVILLRSTVYRTRVSVPHDTGSMTVMVVLVPKSFAWKRVLSEVSSLGCSAVNGGLFFFFLLFSFFCELFVKEQSCFLSEA